MIPGADLESCLYRGHVAHRRHHPRPHAFRYKLDLLYLDLAELEQAFAGRWLWSMERWNVISFRRKHYLGDPQRPLREALLDLVQERLDRRPGGPVRVLTQPAYFGYCFNPVSFYYVYGTDQELEAVVAEITNTPWGERHAYVLDARQAVSEPGEQRAWTFAKEFHVSPFFDMQHDLRWVFSTPGRELRVEMSNSDRSGGARHVFDASLRLERHPLSGPAMARALARHPLHPIGVHMAIYWQALRLWLKRMPFFAHPSKRSSERPLTSVNDRP